MSEAGSGGVQVLVRLGFAEGRMWSGLGSWGKGLGVGFTWFSWVSLGVNFCRLVWVLKGRRFAEGLGVGEGLVLMVRSGIR